MIDYELVEKAVDPKEWTCEDGPVSIITYRGFVVPIYSDDNGQQFYCKFNNEEIGFGAYNTNYQDDLKYLIDNSLDTIHVFEQPYFGAKLEYFNNGGFRDIQLRYRYRILKVFILPENYLLKDDTRVWLINTAREILNDFFARSASDNLPN